MRKVKPTQRKRTRKDSSSVTGSKVRLLFLLSTILAILLIFSATDVDPDRKMFKFDLMPMMPSIPSNENSKPEIQCPNPLNRINSTSTRQEELQLPNLLIVGAPKSGTTALTDWLFRTNQLCLAKRFRGEPSYYRKEVHFFDEDHRFQQGAAFYAQRFGHCNLSHTPFVLDASPDTMLYLDRVVPTYRAFPSQKDKLKIILTLREPIARELSWYNHRRSEPQNYWKELALPNNTQHAASFSELATEYILPAIQQQQPSPSMNKFILEQRTGLYSLYVKQLLRYFSRHQILILSYDELKHNQSSYLGRIRRFLCLPPTGNLEPMGISNQKRTFETYPTCRIQSELAKWYEPYNQELYQLLKEHQGTLAEQYPFPRFRLGNCTN